MSSIYKKGRDGYYYYQAYIRNAKTGKKDKRIFHSLGTKNLLEAEAKKKELDKHYEYQNQNKDKFWGKFLDIQNVNQKKIIFFLALPLMFFFLLRMINNNKNASEASSVSFESAYESQLDTQNFMMLKGNSKFENIKEPLLDTINKPKDSSNYIVPNYTIIRVDSLSDTFHQCKIFATTDNVKGSKSKFLLCRDIKKRFSGFSNIVICIYKNDEPGVRMAKDGMINVSSEDKKKSWLAMYSYHAVEGEYFDDNPGSYIGVY